MGRSIEDENQLSTCIFLISSAPFHLSILGIKRGVTVQGLCEGGN